MRFRPVFSDCFALPPNHILRTYAIVHVRSFFFSSSHRTIWTRSPRPRRLAYQLVVVEFVSAWRRRRSRNGRRGHHDSSPAPRTYLATMPLVIGKPIPSSRCIELIPTAPNLEDMALWSLCAIHQRRQKVFLPRAPCVTPFTSRNGGTQGCGSRSARHQQMAGTPRTSPSVRTRPGTPALPDHATKPSACVFSHSNLPFSWPLTAASAHSTADTPSLSDGIWKLSSEPYGRDAGESYLFGAFLF